MITGVDENRIKELVRELIDEGYHFNVNGVLEERRRFVVSEGLTMTYSYGKVAKIMNNRYNMKRYGCRIDCLDKNPDNDFHTMMKNKTNTTDKTTRDNSSWMETYLIFDKGIKCEYNVLGDMVLTMDACGWYFAGFIDLNTLEIDKTINQLSVEKYRNRPCKLQFYPKFNQEYKSSSLSGVCYHICPTRVVDKILRQGITPHNNGRVVNHPERTYLFLKFNKRLTDIASNFRQSGDNERYTLLCVDILPLLKKGVKFYYDANTMTNNPAVYTLESIPPTCITVIENEK